MTVADIELVKFSARRSGAGITITGQDANGCSFRFAGLDEVVLEGGTIVISRHGPRLGIQAVGAPAVSEPA